MGMKSYETAIKENDFSDEDQYMHTLGWRRHYRPFDQAKDTYIQFLLLLLRCYDEAKESARRLDYLYATALRMWYSIAEIQSGTLHLGLFYEVVLQDCDIMVSSSASQR